VCVISIRYGAPSRLYARLCHAFLVWFYYSENLKFHLMLNLSFGNAYAVNCIQHDCAVSVRSVCAVIAVAMADN